MQESITIAGTRICIGHKLQANKEAQVRGICKSGDIVEVKTIRVGDRTHIGIFSNKPIKGWGDLDGTVLSGCGSWQDSRYLLNFFDLIHREKVVVGNFVFKKRNLKEMKCKVVHHDSARGQSFVEFDEDVGGGSADGLGKAGRCVVLPSELLEDINEQSESKPKEKKKDSVEPVKEENDKPAKAKSDAAWLKATTKLWVKDDFVLQWETPMPYSDSEPVSDLFEDEPGFI